MIQDGSWENAISDNTKGTNYTPDVRYNPPIPDEGEEADERIPGTLQPV